VQDKILISRRESAALLSISLRTLDKIVAEKGLPTKKIRSRVLIPRRALEQFAEGRGAAQRNPPPSGDGVRG
jgi:excisionase family DNA binding protein